jgi:dGTPase
MSADAFESRFFREKKNADARTPAQVDRDRILYSTAFARLAEVTQVVPSGRGHGFHNRLTHSLKVAQLARRIAEGLKRSQPEVAESIGGVCEDRAEAAALGHDLGHPPFGHAAETELNRLAKIAGCNDGFEGNAQSFRIATRLATGDAVIDDDGNPDDAVEGLNLTRGTLKGLLKYPWQNLQNPASPDKWGAYSDDAELFTWALLDATPFVKSAEAEIMDWADDITFAVHDLFDFYRAGLVPLDRLIQEQSSEAAAFMKSALGRSKKLAEDPRRAGAAFAELCSRDLLTIIEPYQDTFSHKTDIWRATTSLITRFVNSIGLKKPESGNPRVVQIDQHARFQVEILKEITWRYVILRHDLNTEQVGQIKMIRTLFWHFFRASRDESRWRFFPARFREDLEEKREYGSDTRTRVVVDCVASMTEAELVHQYRSIIGIQ